MRKTLTPTLAALTVVLISAIGCSKANPAAEKNQTQNRIDAMLDKLQKLPPSQRADTGVRMRREINDDATPEQDSRYRSLMAAVQTPSSTP